VLAHGVVIAGFGFLAQSWLYDPFGSTPASLLAIVPAVLVALGFRRWLRGRQRWLVAFDALIATAGLLGIWFWTAFPYASGGQQLALDDVAVGIAIAASFVALAASLHAMPRTSPGVHPAAPVDTAPPADRDARDVPTPAGVADPPTR
jgi:hypothetical protein